MSALRVPSTTIPSMTSPWIAPSKIWFEVLAQFANLCGSLSSSLHIFTFPLIFWYSLMHLATISAALHEGTLRKSSTECTASTVTLQSASTSASLFHCCVYNSAQFSTVASAWVTFITVIGPVCTLESLPCWLYHMIPIPALLCVPRRINHPYPSVLLNNYCVCDSALMCLHSAQSTVGFWHGAFWLWQGQRLVLLLLQRRLCCSYIPLAFHIRIMALDQIITPPPIKEPEKVKNLIG